jgi:thiamine pyrophosphate-dependent acetolactate synthase large subunit-like protein
VHTLELFRGLGDSQITAVVPRHEQGAGFMADGYARASGNPGVCLLTTGPGVTNALTPLAQAFHDSSAVLVVASETDRTLLHKGRGPLHDLPDQRALVAQVTAYSETVGDQSELPAKLGAAWSCLERPRRRPAYLGVPIDILAEPSAPFAPKLHLQSPPAPAPEKLDSAAELLIAAQRPILVLGGGAVDAGAAAIELATQLDAPIALTGNAKGTVPSTHPLCLGSTLPFGSVRELIADADVALLVGTELSEVDVIYTGVRLRFPGRVIRVDVDPAQLDAGTTATVGVVGDANLTLTGLLERVLASASPARPDRGAAARVRSALDAIRWTAQSITHLPWLAAIDRALPADRIVSLDSTQLAYTALHAMGAEQPRSWLAPYGFGTLGPALPMAIGAKLARPDAATVVLVGDGGLMFTVAELVTAAALGLNLPVLVWNNDGYGEIRDSFARAGMTAVGCDTTAADLGAIARGCGCASALAGSPDELAGEITRALDRDRPTLIEIPVA